VHKADNIQDKHPQTNGKIEKLFDCYNRYRDDFESLDDFVYWYNNVRFHESLDTKHYLQTLPEDAFWSRLPVEARLGVAFKLFDKVVGNERYIKSKISGLHASDALPVYTWILISLHITPFRGCIYHIIPESRLVQYLLHHYMPCAEVF